MQPLAAEIQRVAAVRLSANGEDAPEVQESAFKYSHLVVDKCRFLVHC